MDSKILFLDLDGTLLNDQKDCTEKNRRAMERAIARGHRLVITSGRPLKSALLQAERLGLAGEGCYVIAYNGAVLYDCSHRKEIFRKALPLEAVYRIFDEANRRRVHIQTYRGENVIVEPGNDNETVRRYCSLAGMSFQVVEDIRRALAEPPVKALLIDFQDRNSIEAMKQWICAQMQGSVDCCFSSQSYLEVVPAGVNKGCAVTTLCQKLGVAVRNAVAVGDEANDISMLQAAGVGVAMQNAAPEVKAAADYITERDNNQDGIEEVIERFLGESADTKAK